MVQVDFETHLGSDVVAPFLVERLVGGTTSIDAPVHLVQLAQPPGDFSDPPMSDLVITAGLSTHRTTYRNADFRFTGQAMPGEWAVFARGEANSIIIDDPSRFIAIAIPASVADPLLDSLWPDHANQFARLHRRQHAGLVPQLIERLWHRAGARLAEDAGQLYCDALVTVLVSELMHSAQVPVAPFRGGLAGWQRRRVAEYIDAAFDRDIALADLAGLCGLSEDHFARAFRGSFGIPPYRYQLRLRLERAKELLADPELPVGAVAAMVGFPRSQGLTRLFLRELGITPLRFRRDVLGH
ncbi:MAG: AraC family transcriptional regulator [Erythrobacter sp.]|uniref:helix-turn-helix transcriptional regulator n=1 Tax=Erythrobacter sp. TaxID=1042 RepID=UPI0025FDA14C|nr:AraC family transcriptional regulator [Erythrobacter sp.]MCM0000117.1 AraC family transcriptional regulator [Erythrobacter sp.]